ncbi:hypothetical protein J2W34_006610 [Variovorax boronicumulans]|uniref:DUF2846 domain-containing protein n=1 Tax=Variovorax boronicumulans TaxID=436515 RepID=UPI0027862946|nr:DUF2846 domain-containing protein [Variovorax boronicumulans]MDQ0074784.1 hypothetical protein [Variovorax boronicumulans]
MRRWFGGCVLAVLAACLFGCSATGPRFSEVSQNLPSLGENEGRIYFYRDSILGMAVQPEVSVNGQVVGKSQPNGFFFIDRPAGTYRATARTEAEGSIDVVLRPKQTAYVQMSISMGFMVGHPAFQRVGESEGRSALPSLAYSGMGPVSTKAASTAPAAVTSDTTATATANSTPTAAPATATPVRQVAVAPNTEAPAVVAIPSPAPAIPPPATPSPAPTPSPAAPEATPFAKTPVNDLRLLLQPAR